MRQGSADRLLILCSAPSLMEYTSQQARLRFDFLLLICFVDTNEPENSSAGTPSLPPGRINSPKFRFESEFVLSPTKLSIRVRRSGCSSLRPLPARWRFLGVAAGYRE